MEHLETSDKEFLEEKANFFSIALNISVDFNTKAEKFKKIMKSPLI